MRLASVSVVWCYGTLWLLETSLTLIPCPLELEETEELAVVGRPTNLVLSAGLVILPCEGAVVA